MTGTPEDDLAIDDLRTYVTAVEEGSLNATAQRLGQPKSTISRRLSRLEERLGARVVNRGPRGLSPTDTGRILFEPAKAILQSVASLAELAREGMAEPRGRLRVSAPQDLAGMPLWMSYAERYPRVDLQLEFTNRYVDLVSEDFDVALRGGRGDDVSLIVRRMGGYNLRAVASPRWVERYAPLPEQPPLRELDCVLLVPFRGIKPSSRGKGRAKDEPPIRHLVANDLSTVLDGALRGLGAAFLPDHVCMEHVRKGDLLIVHPAYDPLQVPLYAAYPDRRYMPASLSAFLELVTTEFSPTQAAPS